MRGNSILGNSRVGVEIKENAVAGGVVILDTARVDLGGGSLSIGGQVVASTGNNRIEGNGTHDLRNQTG